MLLSRLAAIAGAVAFASSANALVNPFTETFNTDASSWRNAAGSADATWVATGGPDSSAFITGATNVNSASFNTVVALRGQDSYDSSNDAFVGNWIAGGVTLFSFDVRHDGPEPIGFGVRIATPANNPGAVGVSFTPVVPGVWTTISIAIDPSNPQFISFGSGDFNSVFSDVGNIQISYTVPSSLAGTGTIVNVDLDNVSIVPAPGALAALGLFGVATVRRRRR